VQIDLTSPQGHDDVLRLLADADVLVDNFRPGVMDRLGLTQQCLQQANPRLIHCSITGFGTDGPYAMRPAYDTVGIALSGILHMYLDRDQPQVYGPTLADNATGVYAFGGILAALHARERTGLGQRVELNMLESAIAFVPDAFAYFSRLGVEYEPVSRVATSQSFAWTCADGEAIAVHLSVPEKFWFGLLDAMDLRTTIGEDSRFQSPLDRIRNYGLLAPLLGAVIVKHPRAHWERAFADHDIPFAPVHSIADVIADPQVRHLGTFAEVEHETEGRIIGIRNPLRINGVRSEVGAPPVLGEHSTILRGV
ncbi:MAG: CoA transferase, partial [Sphingobium sp.]